MKTIKWMNWIVLDSLIKSLYWTSMNRVEVNENGFYCSIRFVLCIEWRYPLLSIVIVLQTMIYFQSWNWYWIVQKHCISSISTWYTIDRVVRKRSNEIVYWDPRLNWESGVSINCFGDRFKLCSFVLSMIIL